MNVKVKIGERTFEVEVGDLQARPIVAIVDGERFEVWPEETVPAPAQSVPTIPTATPAASAASHSSSNSVHAPIPGVIASVAVGPGDTVAVGQELCVLEAMKMKNVIRAARSGKVSTVRVTAGQTVKHREVLMEYDRGRE